MSYAPHILIAFGGRLFGDTWNCTVRMFSANYGPGMTASLDDLDGLISSKLGDVAADVAAFVSAPQSWMPPQARLDYVKGNVIGADGRYAYPRTNAHFYDPASAPAGAGTGTVLYPPQTALVVSTTTDAARGRAHAGRMYLPTNIPLITDSARIPPFNQDAVRDRFKTLLNALNNWPGLDIPASPNVTVMSALDGSHHKVTGVRVGNVLDTQRRRRNAMNPEGYSSVAL